MGNLTTLKEDLREKKYADLAEIIIGVGKGGKK